MHSHHEDPTWQEGGETGSVRGRRTVRRDTSQAECVGVRRERNPMDRKNAMTLTDEQRAVNSMIRAGQSFDEIEDYINALALPSAHLGALWLLAWTEATDPQMRSQLIADTISALPDTSGGSASCAVPRAD